jgi:hypothetical protein
MAAFRGPPIPRIEKEVGTRVGNEIDAYAGRQHDRGGFRHDQRRRPDVDVEVDFRLCGNRHARNEKECQNCYYTD